MIDGIYITGNTAYDGYRQWHKEQINVELPEFSSLTPDMQHAWAAAGRAVLNQIKPQVYAILHQSKGE